MSEAAIPGTDGLSSAPRLPWLQLVLNSCFAEPLSGEFAACFADAPEDECVALGGSFAFANCEENRDLCEVVSRSAQPAAD
ncbi:hypothetical protein [Trebonia sp.]|uniref:hypothetical protein n=1 Tax=Trebonia sp. TaxID=2767075 RepID=UPI002601C09C|nr:hypothetical protein [Trebonia sp.]